MVIRQVAKLALAKAQANVGVVEEGENAGKYIHKYQQACIPVLSSGSPWCAAFMVYRFLQAFKQLDIDAGDFPTSGYCPDWQRWGKSKSRWIDIDDAESEPDIIEPGDVCLFWFSPKGRVAHIGIVESVHDWGVYTIEGNTGPEVGTVNRDGDGVYRKKRDWREFGAGGGFIRMK